MAITRRKAFIEETPEVEAPVEEILIVPEPKIKPLSLDTGREDLDRIVAKINEIIDLIK